MTLSVAVSAEGMRVPVAADRLADLAKRVLESEGVSHAMLSIAFVSSTAIATMNRKHLGKRGTTDIIAFGLGSATNGTPAIGDVYISAEVARRNAIRFRVPVREEIARLVIHGTLHVLGYTHPDGERRVASKMWKKQEEHLRRSLARARKK